MIDTLYRIETPEGVELALPVAGPVARARAWSLDLLVKLGILWAAALGLALLGPTGMGLYLVFWFFVFWLYPIVFEARGGATPGKRVVGLRVVHDNGTPIGWTAATIRSLVGFADSLPGCYGVGLLSTLLNPHGRRLGDLAAGTLVVYVDPSVASAWSSTALPVPPPHPLRPEEQQTIVDFAERAVLLTAERREELARIVEPLTGPGRRRFDALMSQAAWIAGHR